MNLHYCPSSSNNVGIPVSRTYRALELSVTTGRWPILVSLFYPHLFLSSRFLLDAQYILSPRHARLSFSTVLDCSTGGVEARPCTHRAILFTKIIQVTGVTRRLYKSIPSISRASTLERTRDHTCSRRIDSRVKMIFHSTFFFFWVSAYLVNVTRTSLTSDPTRVITPSPFLPPVFRHSLVRHPRLLRNSLHRD